MKVFKILAGIIIPLCILSLLFFYFFQERLIFLKQPITEEQAKDIKRTYPETEEVKIKTPEGVRLHGWYINNSQEKETPLVIYFGGNAQETSGMLQLAGNFKNWDVVFMNYRGYGLSEGSPGERKIFHDALFVYDHFKNKEHINSGKIVPMGWSLGTGPAVYLAEKRDVAGVILVSPYDSVKEVASRSMPFLAPFVEMLLKHPFDSISRAPNIDVPGLTLVASEDEVISPTQSEKLMQEWGGEYDLKYIDGENHTSIHYNDQYWKYVNNFLSEI